MPTKKTGAKKKTGTKKKTAPKKKTVSKKTTTVKKKAAAKPAPKAAAANSSDLQTTTDSVGDDHVMKRFQSAESQWRFSRQAAEQGKWIGYVPTMGAFHEGHLTLIKKSVTQNDVTVVSVFINPLQFNDDDDYNKYPRDLARDTDLARQLGVDAVFIPEPTEMYPEEFTTKVTVGPMAQRLCGAHRPGHFDGVCTAVMKLLGIVQPYRLYLGEKDAQQLQIIRRIVIDMNLHVKVVSVPTKREKDGLAMSSRNALLSEGERAEAVKLYEALRMAQKDILIGNERDPESLIGRMRAHILSDSGFEIDYVAAVDPETLEDRSILKGRTLIALAARLGSVRLIDNILINVPGGQLAAGLSSIGK